MNDLTEPVCRVCLPVSGWSIRVARGADDRPALEVYNGVRLADVSVATSLSVALLRGAVRSRRGATPWGLAWGQLPPGAQDPTIVFSGRDGCRQVKAHIVQDSYWVAEESGDFTGITIVVGATHTTGRLRREPA
jgi:hypothetical protein